MITSTNSSGVKTLYEWEVSSKEDDLPEIAFKWFRRSAELGYEEGDYELACAYLFGHGVEENVSQSIEWFRQLSERGNPDAQVMLGLAYARDEVDQSPEESARLFRAAAEQETASGRTLDH